MDSLSLLDDPRRIVLPKETLRDLSYGDGDGVSGRPSVAIYQNEHARTRRFTLDWFGLKKVCRRWQRAKTRPVTRQHRCQPELVSAVPLADGPCLSLGQLAQRSAASASGARELCSRS